jgi:hypothetical protein
MTTVISPEQALASVKKSLGLDSSGDRLSDATLAQAARRAIHIMAPCPPHALARSVRQSFAWFGLEEDVLAERVEAVIDGLVVFGDILEMRPAAGDQWEAGNAFLFRPAPPSFAIRKNGSIAILGVGGDLVTPLTRETEARLSYRGVLRILEPEPEEDIAGLLRETGFLELSEKVWLRTPKIEAARVHAAFWRQQLAKEPPSPGIDGLTILHAAKARNRWSEPGKDDSGIYVARRPQRYGADRWCLAELEHGVVKRFKDLVSPGDRIRPCDVAWRIQAAFDAETGKPQRYLRETTGNRANLSFFGPLPSWAERQLSIVGEKAKGERGLFSYELPEAERERECRFLHETLWMTESSSDRRSSGAER